MANNIVPAVVLFSILLGVALMGIQDKDALIKVLSTSAEALVKITGIIVKLTPFGVFAISAAAAGTMTIDYLGRLQVYLISFFGGGDVALPFMLDLMRLPSDMYQLYVVTGVINGRSSTLLAAMNLLVFTMLTTASLTDTMKINKQKVIMVALACLGLTVAVIPGSRLYFSAVVKNEYQKDAVVSGMQLLQDPAPYRLYHEVPENLPDTDLSKQTPMERIKKTETIRMGYDPNRIPFSYFNTV
ncbi:MAG: cation:dicarboxylase symporter family transporter [bacterium]|nr:cation:dicarboxylase symporter family transporter [bacterium]